MQPSHVRLFVCVCKSVWYNISSNWVVSLLMLHNHNTSFSCHALIQSVRNPPSYLRWTLSKFHIESIVLYDGFLLGFFNQVIETSEEGALGGDIVQHSSHSLVPALNDNVFHSRLMAAEVSMN